MEISKTIKMKITMTMMTMGKQQQYYSTKSKWLFSKTSIKQGERDYKKWMGILMDVKSSMGKEAIDQINQKLCMMIIKHEKTCREQGSITHQVSAGMLTMSMIKTIMTMAMLI